MAYVWTISLAKAKVKPHTGARNERKIIKSLLLALLDSDLAVIVKAMNLSRNRIIECSLDNNGQILGKVLLII